MLVIIAMSSLILLQDHSEMDVEAYLRRRYESDIANIEIVEKEDLDLVRNFFITNL